MTNPTDTTTKSSKTTKPAKPSPRKTSPAKKEPVPLASDTTGDLVKLIARGWASELKAVAAVEPTTAHDIKGMRRRLQRLTEAMRETEKTLEGNA